MDNSTLSNITKNEDNKSDLLTDKIIEDAFIRFKDLHCYGNNMPKAREAFELLVDDLKELTKSGAKASNLSGWLNGRFWSLPWDAWSANLSLYENFGKASASLGLLAGWNLLEIADRTHNKNGEIYSALTQGILNSGIDLSVNSTDGSKDWFVWHLCSNASGDIPDKTVQTACVLAKKLPESAWFIDKSWWGSMESFLPALPLYSALKEDRAKEFSLSLIDTATKMAFSESFWLKASKDLKQLANSATEKTLQINLDYLACVCEGKILELTNFGKDKINKKIEDNLLIDNYYLDKDSRSKKSKSI